VRYHPKDEEKGGLSSGLTWESANIEEYLVMRFGVDRSKQGGETKRGIEAN
jgi:hypothetical protein